MRRSTSLGCMLAIAGALACGMAAAQQNYPTKPVRFIVTYPPGGSSEVMGRIIGKPELSHHREALRCKCLVELDYVEVTDLEAQPVEQPIGRRCRPYAHDPWRDPGHRRAHDPGARH